jgi:AraC-like DNA-binding protein
MKKVISNPRVSLVIINRIYTVYHQIHHQYGWVTRQPCRHADGLAFVLDGSATYSFKNRKITVSRNDILYLRKGESYTSHSSKTSSRPYTIILVNFSYDDSLPVTILPLESCTSVSSESLILDLFKNLLCVWNSNAPHAQIKSFSLLYEIIYLLLSSADIDSHCNPHQKIVESIEYIDSHYNKNITLAELSKLSHMSVPHLVRNFAQALNMSPIKYLISVRIKHAKRLLRDRSILSISEVAEKTGFNSTTYFSRIFKCHEGICPSKYQKAAISDNIDFVK